MRTATKADFKIGAKLVSSEGRGEFTISSCYHETHWSARGARGSIMIAEGEARFWLVKE